MACFSDYVPYSFGALLVCLFRRDRDGGMEYLINFELCVVGLGQGRLRFPGIIFL